MPHPFHAGPLDGFANAFDAGRHIACAGGAGFNALESRFPETNSASARRSPVVRLLAIGSIDVPVHYRARTYGTTQIRRFRDGLHLLRMVITAFFDIKMGRVP